MLASLVNVSIPRCPWLELAYRIYFLQISPISCELTDFHKFLYLETS